MKALAPIVVSFLVLPLGCPSRSADDSVETGMREPGASVSSTYQASSGATRIGKEGPPSARGAPGVMGAGSSSRPPPAPKDGERVPTPAERSACLGAPLSPGADALPVLSGLHHEVETPRVHLFLPEKLNTARAKDLERLAEKARAFAEGLRTADGTPLEMGTGVCGRSRRRDAWYCLSFRAQLCEPWLPIAEKLAPFAAAEGLGVAVEIVGDESPRCVDSGTNCEPLPYHLDGSGRTDEQTWDGLFTLPRDPQRPRTAIKPEFGSGLCSGDGDCIKGGCGNECRAWYRPASGGSCVGYWELADAYCGCVESRCTWFTQGREVRVSTELSADGWADPMPRYWKAVGLPPRELSPSELGKVLFKQALEGDRFRRQLLRLAGSSSIPSELSFAFAWRTQGGVSELTLSTPGRDLPPWVRPLFLHLAVPHPEAAQPRTKLVRVRGKLTIEGDLVFRQDDDDAQ